MSAPRPWMKSWRKTRRSAQERAKRIRILNAELDVLRGASSERSRTIDTKASFIVVVAGVLASVTGLSLVSTETWLVGLLPFGLTVAAVAVATAALWPRKIDLPSAREVVDAWVDADMPADELEDNVLEVKAQEVTNRDAQNEKRAKLTNWGFGLVLAGLVTTLAVVILTTLSPTWSNHDETEPTQTPVNTQAPAAT
ncbi:hypothetical protein [Agromyces bauzanensis]|uniref:hypothetical protein n=1 Tax=Agromyces bauzanensis TaxID=1308924 RepID=UPI00166C007D|nr:hypothetical protein [Agromyces bauzanensis]